MLLDWIDSINLIKHDKDSNVLAIFPPSIRRTLISEVVNFLHASPEGIGELTSGLHVRWVMELVGQAFSLPLDDITVISQAADIYLQWLVEIPKRPSFIQTAELNEQQEFLQIIIKHLSLLFSAKKCENNKTHASSLAIKHVELCKAVLNTFNQLSIRTCKEEGSFLSSKTIKVLIRVLLGCTDYVLRVPTGQNYLSEEISEYLLATLIEIWLRVQLFSKEMWFRLKILFGSWTHRMVVISQWNAVALALSQRISKIIYGQGTSSIVYTVFSSLVSLDITDRFAVFAWYQFLNLIPKPENLNSQICFRAATGIERIIHVFHSIQSGDEPRNVLERFFPDANTILYLFGEWLFDAANLPSNDYSEARAHAFGMLCRIFVAPQRRNHIRDSFCHQFYSALIEGLQGDFLSVVFIVVNCEDIFVSSLPSVRILVPHFVCALRRIIPNMERQLRVSINIDDLRRACYKLLCTMFSFGGHFDDCTLRSMELCRSFRTSGPCPVEDSSHSSLQNKIIERLAKVYESLTLPNSIDKASMKSIKFLIFELLINSLIFEKDPGNSRYLINCITTFTIDEVKHFPSLSAVIVDLMVELLCCGRWPIDVCHLAVESLIQLNPSSLQLQDHHIERSALLSLFSLISTLVGKNNLPVLQKLIMHLIECCVSWILEGSNTSLWFSSDVECFSSMIQVLVQCIGLAKSENLTADSSSMDLKRRSATPPPGSASSPGSVVIVSPVMSSKSYEAQLSIIARSALKRIFLQYANVNANQFYPFNVSCLLNENHLLENNGLDLDFVAGRPKSIADLSPDQYKHLQFYLVNGDTIVSFIQKPLKEGFERFHSENYAQELISIARFSGGRLAWESTTIYTDDPISFRHLIPDPISSSNNDPTVETLEFNAKDPFDYENTFADSVKFQRILEEQNPDISKKPILLSEIGPLFNDEIIQNRFKNDEKRIFNYDSLLEVVTLNIKNVGELMIRDGPALRNFRSRKIPRPNHPSSLSSRFLTQLGITNIKNYDSALRIPCNATFLQDLSQLDSLPERENITCNVYFVKSARQKIGEILNTEVVCEDFVDFLHSLAWPVNTNKHSGFLPKSDDSFTSLYYADSRVELVFETPYICPPRLDEVPLQQSIVTVLWIEDLQDMLTLPGKFMSHSVVYICVNPLTDHGSTGLYRIRIMVTNTGAHPSNQTTGGETVYLFGPLLDGMVIRRESLANLVRETVISATLFYLYGIQNNSRPYVKRWQLLKQIIGKHRPNDLSISHYYSDLLMQSSNHVINS